MNTKKVEELQREIIYTVTKENGHVEKYCLADLEEMQQKARNLEDYFFKNIIQDSDFRCVFREQTQQIISLLTEIRKGIDSYGEGIAKIISEQRIKISEAKRELPLV